MNKAFGVALLVAGVVLLVMGLNASNSFDSDVSRFFTGSPSDKSIWLIVSGLAASIVGLFFAIGRRRILKQVLSGS